MKTNLKFQRPMAGLLILALLHLCWVSSTAWAEMVRTESAVHSQAQTQSDRQRLLDLLNREEVQKELEQYGISKVEAVARIHSLTDEEVTALVTEIDQIPAGGFLRALFLSAVLTAYLLRVLYRGIDCLFSDDEALNAAGDMFLHLS